MNKIKYYISEVGFVLYAMLICILIGAINLFNSKSIWDLED